MLYQNPKWKGSAGVPLGELLTTVLAKSEQARWLGVQLVEKVVGAMEDVVLCQTVASRVASDSHPSAVRSGGSGL